MNSVVQALPSVNKPATSSPSAANSGICSFGTVVLGECKCLMQGPLLLFVVDLTKTHRAHVTTGAVKGRRHTAVKFPQPLDRFPLPEHLVQSLTGMTLLPVERQHARDAR